MKLLLVVAYFVPRSESAHIYFDLAKAFVARGMKYMLLLLIPGSSTLARVMSARSSPWMKP